MVAVFACLLGVSRCGKFYRAGFTVNPVFSTGNYKREGEDFCGACIKLVIKLYRVNEITRDNSGDWVTGAKVTDMAVIDSIIGHKDMSVEYITSRDGSCTGSISVT